MEPKWSQAATSVQDQASEAGELESRWKNSPQIEVEDRECSVMMSTGNV